MVEILEPWIHFIHVLGAIIWVGGVMQPYRCPSSKSEDPPAHW
jgi:uncharacterized membrane protein